jgi:hypothetical protein
MFDISVVFNFMFLSKGLLMIAVFLCSFSGCTDLCDLDIVFNDTGSCLSRSLITIVEYFSEIYYVFSTV